MLTIPRSVCIYMAPEPVDGRKGFNGLTAIVRDQWRRDVYSGHLFVFLGRRRNLVKVLAWDRSGFALHIKKLERGRFTLPPLRDGAAVIELDATQLAMLLDGIDVRAVRRQPIWEPPSTIT